MDFVTTIKRDAIGKYQDALMGTTDSPYEKDPELANSSDYSNARESYYKRLSEELNAFNNAVEDIHGQLAKIAMEYWDKMLKDFHCKQAEDLIKIHRSIKNNKNLQMALKYARESGKKEILDPILTIIENQEITAKENSIQRNVIIKRRIGIVLSAIFLLLSLIALIGLSPISDVWFGIIDNEVGKIITIILLSLYVVIAPLINCLLPDHCRSKDAAVASISGIFFAVFGAIEDASSVTSSVGTIIGLGLGVLAFIVTLPVTLFLTICRIGLSRNKAVNSIIIIDILLIVIGFLSFFI